MTVLRMNFGAMVAARGAIDLSYDIERTAHGPIRVARRGSAFDQIVADTGSLILVLESDLIVQVQLLQPGRLFVHAAALELNGTAHMLVGPSGAGKSTTCWGLLHNDFRYLSDEMAPSNHETMSVAPYSHAVCMKRPPPRPYLLDDDVLVTSRGFHVPAQTLPQAEPGREPPLESLFLVEYDPDRRQPALEPIGAAAAATRLYPSILNALAHDNAALGAAADLATRARCYVLKAAALDATCRLVRDAVTGAPDAGTGED